MITIPGGGIGSKICTGNWTKRWCKSFFSPIAVFICFPCSLSVVLLIFSHFSFCLFLSWMIFYIYITMPAELCTRWERTFLTFLRCFVCQCAMFFSLLLVYCVSPLLCFLQNETLSFCCCSRFAFFRSPARSLIWSPSPFLNSKVYVAFTNLQWLLSSP